LAKLSGRHRGSASIAAAGLAVVLGVGGYGLWREQCGLKLVDRSGVVGSWSFGEAASVPPGGARVLAIGDGRFDIFWQARECATEPHFLVTGSSEALRVRVDRQDDRCSGASQPYRLRLEAAPGMNSSSVSVQVSG
jgi:hypothetical protein